MLTLHPDELARTDVADHALDALRESRIEEVVVLGRRGPAQAAFTSAELRELGRLDGVELRVSPEDAMLDPLSERWLAERGTFTARTNVALLGEFAGRDPQPESPRRIVLRFLSSPLAIRGSEKVETIDVGHNEIVEADDGSLRPRALGDDVETIECGLVLRSVGYRAVPLPGVPFDERSYILPNERGRVLASDGEPLPGVYAVGWIKRGPTGILGTNKRDAEETARCIAEDLESGALSAPERPGREAIDALLTERKPDLVTVDGWRAIDAVELRAGEEQERPRVKLSSRDELLAAAQGGG
jgi:ferredoxin--NADP+ reductase